ncbi:asparagine synthase-related protein [Peribacillus butanolivorans]|uniref:asparagine synthase-related protein n=1 Tax=Peribacillus butanolivorans TaxID=421767 RepID=UPI002E1FD4F6|nr:asparagine synthase-related protein [Peribacillus butanolivorans]MED3689587.1 asparagine synthase-related protein [Peribacillus butanolivorans]
MQGKAVEIKKIMEQYPQYQDTLFSRGYLITSKEINDLSKYPFYSNWKKVYSGEIRKEKPNLNIYIHNKQDCYMYEENGIHAVIIGNAYNPFDMKYQEEELLKDCVQAYRQSKETFFDKISEFTGVHLIVIWDNVNLIAVQDCAGMKSCYFGRMDGNMYITSYPQLVADICDLKVDPFVEKLTKSYSYNIGNKHLPGNLTPFKELKRLGGNTYVEFVNEFKVKRFYPVKPHDEIKSKDQFNSGIEKITDILHRNIELATMKWKRPAISLSGGMDSKTTLASANGLYDRFTYFSFHSKPQEIVDANAAHKICEEIGLEHTIYPIPDSNDDVEDFDILKMIIDHNTSYFKNTADHEIRKMIFLYRLNTYDVELKSWASEIGRCSLERRYGIKMPSVLTPRHYSIFQTRFIFAPLLLRKTENYYKKFLYEVGLDQSHFNFEQTDLYHWEVRLGAWGTSVVSSFDFCHNVTMPFNNRKLIELILSFPHDNRRDGLVQDSAIKYSNSKIHNMNLTVKNDYSKKHRQKLEQIYYYYRTLVYNSKK